MVDPERLKSVQKSVIGEIPEAGDSVFWPLGFLEWIAPNAGRARFDRVSQHV